MIHKNNTVSVAMCTYNGEKYITEQLDSILRQTHCVDEIVIVDDSSKDSTINILREYEERYPQVRVFVNDVNKGFVFSFQRAIMNTSCEYIALCDQDDIWTDDHIEILLPLIQGKVMSVGNCRLVDSNAVSMNTTIFDIRDFKYVPISDVEKAYRIVYFGNPYFGSNMLVRRDWILKVIPFPQGTTFHDIYLSIAACLTGGLACTSLIVNNYRQHPNQVTKNERIPIYKELWHRRHFSFWPDRTIFIKAIEESGLVMSADAQKFVEEFHKYESLEKADNRWEMFTIRIKHFRDIYSTPFYKFVLLRSIHFLLAK